MLHAVRSLSRTKAPAPPRGGRTAADTAGLDVFGGAGQPGLSNRRIEYTDGGRQPLALDGEALDDLRSKHVMPLVGRGV